MTTCPDICTRFVVAGHTVTIPCELDAGHETPTNDLPPIPHYSSGVHVEHMGAKLDIGPIKWVGRKVLIL